MANNRIENTDFNKLIGKWKTEGRVLTTGNNSEMKIKGTDTYEIILDGFFILHKADVLMGNENSQTYELIGLDNNDQRAIFEHYNNQGSSGRMTGHLKNGNLQLKVTGFDLKVSSGTTTNNLMGLGKNSLTKINGWNFYT